MTFDRPDNATSDRIHDQARRGAGCRWCHGTDHATDEHFAYAFTQPTTGKPYPIPDDLRTAAERIARAYSIGGQCDPMWIANVIARELGIGTGESEFTAPPERWTPPHEPSTQTLTQMEFSPEDHDKSDQIACSLGYEQTAYTSTSALWGLFCLPENPATWHGDPRALNGGCIIKTKELGFLFVQDGEDVGRGYDWSEA